MLYNPILCSHLKGLSMKCFACQQENPEGAKFCQNCGAPQMVACHSCGTQLPSAARFCFSCGAAQAGAEAAAASGDGKPAVVEEVAPKLAAAEPGPVPAAASGSGLERLERLI